MSAQPITDPERHELVRQVMRSVEIGDDWIELLDPDSPPWLRAWIEETVDRYRAADVEWLVEVTDPEAVIVQPPQLPGSRTYLGKAGVIETLLDWPREWDDFRVQPQRIFATGEDSYIIDAVHRGRSKVMQIDVEARIVWLFKLRNRRVFRWLMFVSLEEALEAASSAAE